jgi:hypothetical protein
MEAGIPMASINARDEKDRLCSQTMAAFSAARGQNLAASVSGITGAEAELARATEFGRSICWFHKKVPLIGKSGREKPLIP